MSTSSILCARIFVVFLCCVALRGYAGTVTVTNDADDGGANTLRVAIAAANAGDTIAFALPVNSVITLASTLTLTKNVTIDGFGTPGLTINGNHAVEIFVVNAGVVATIAHLTIADGSTATVAHSGGILNHGTLTVSGATLSGNSAPNGGAINNDGTLTVTNSTFSGNTTQFGAIYNESTLTVTNSTFSGNPAATSGGAILNNAGSAMITNNTFVGNTAKYGGAIYSYSDQLASTVTNNLFLGNLASQYGGSVGDVGHMINADHNLYWNNTDLGGPQGINCNNCASNTSPVNADPVLGPLQNNGGPTATYLLGVGSAAIDAGTATDCPATDQRGIARPQPVAGACDIGSVETHLTGCYVKAGATGSNNGTSWANAFTDLQSALHDVECDQVWVAKGTYKPTSTADRTISFAVRRNVSLYGGFAGNESPVSLRTSANPAILSGDIGTSDDSSDNSYHVVRLDGTTAAGTITTATNVIDGFRITGGNASGAVPGPDSRGAGLYCDGSGPGHECSPYLNNLDIVGNSAVDWAGGAFFNGENGHSNPLLTNSTFSGNSAQFGGGVMCFGQNLGQSNPTIGNVTFSGNTATVQGGGLYNAAYGGGTSSPTLVNVTFNGNVANDSGGAILNDGRNSGVSLPTLTNVILWGDQAPTHPEIHEDADLPGDSAHITINTSVVQGGCPASGATCNVFVTSTDPLLSAFGDHGGLTSTILPGPTGSAVDGGDDAACAAAPINGIDQRGVARPFLTHCDIGAVEFNDRIFGNGFEGS